MNGSNKTRTNKLRVLSLLLALSMLVTMQGFTSFAQTASENSTENLVEQGEDRQTEKEQGEKNPNLDEQSKLQNDGEFVNGTQQENNDQPESDGSNQLNQTESVSDNSNQADTIHEETFDENNQAGVEGTLANPVHHCTKLNDGTDYTTWSYVYFGSYPQSEVTDSATIAAIENAIATGNATGDTGADVWVDGIKYRRIAQSDSNYAPLFGNSTYRYFKWERIRWRVLKNDGNTLFVVADKGLDCKDYHDDGGMITWEGSALRGWLNESFYQTAFSNREQNSIVEQNVINDNSPYYDTEGGNDTKDKVYLLSIDEATNPSYGFCEDDSITSLSRQLQESDYAEAKGAYRVDPGMEWENNCCWWLRSPGVSSYYALDVNYNGYVHRDGWVVATRIDAVVPALHIKLSSNTWSMVDDGTSGDGGEMLKTAMPSATIASGTTVTSGTKVSLTCPTVGASIYYTTDGTVPSKNSTLYKEAITIDRNMTIKAIAVCEGHYESDIAEFAYTVRESGTGSESSGNDESTAQVKIQKLSIKVPSKKLAAGKKVKLKVTVSPSNSSNQKVTWKTSNKKYATIDKNGKLTLKKAGAGKYVRITATATDGSGVKATVKIKIMKHAVKSIKLKAPSKTLKAGKSMKLKATIETTGKKVNKTLKWTSSNTKYATVSKSGKVKAKKAGKGKTVTITAKSTDGSNKKATVKIKIK